jgi:hypothetical protein
MRRPFDFPLARLSVYLCEPTLRCFQRHPGLTLSQFVLVKSPLRIELFGTTSKAHSVVGSFLARPNMYPIQFEICRVLYPTERLSALVLTLHTISGTRRVFLFFSQVVFRLKIKAAVQH